MMTLGVGLIVVAVVGGLLLWWRGRREPRPKPRTARPLASRQPHETLGDYTRRVEANRLIAMGRLHEATQHLRGER